MREITSKVRPELRADESALDGGSLHGYTNWLVFNDEDQP